MTAEVTNRTPLRLVAVNAGLSEPSSTRLLVDRLTAATADELGARRRDVEVQIVDLRDLAVDIGRSLGAGFATGAAGDAVRDVEAADALIVASPVFNASYSGLFKSFFDLVDTAAMVGKPVLIGATGGSPRHSMVLDHALRPLFSYLRAIVVPTGVYAASEDWAGGSGDTATLSDRIRRAAGELAGVLAAAPARPSGGSAGAAATGEPPVDDAEAAGIANFAQLLGASGR